MSRLVLALQFYAADRDRAMRLAKLIADIEPKPREDVEVVFVARYDCDHDKETISYVSQKFPVHWITTHTKWTGWPGGCTAVALDTLEWVAANRKDAVGVLMIEPDCVPMGADWLNQLLDEWNDARMLDKWIMGAWRDSGGPYGHLNGNCVLLPAFANLVRARDIIGPDLAWDAAVAPYIKDHWYITGAIKNCFESRNATIQRMLTPDVGEFAPALVHGFKDDSAFAIAKEMCAPKEIQL